MSSMSAPGFRKLLFVAVVAVLSACGDNTPTTPIGPTAPPTPITVTFSGTLTRNSAYTHPFSVSDSGDVSVFLLTSADVTNPSNNAIPVGVSLGTWNGLSCAIVVARDQMEPGTSIPLSGRATAAGNLCVRVYDVGFVPVAANYELLIDHY